jgi:hypothetical protein
VPRQSAAVNFVPSTYGESLCYDTADRMFSDAFPTFSLPPTSAGTTAIRPKFVEGTVYQLAKVLYELHVGQEAQPAIAIQEALKTFGHDSDRSPIVQDARESAEALTERESCFLTLQSLTPRLQFLNKQRTQKNFLSHLLASS